MEYFVYAIAQIGWDFYDRLVPLNSRSMVTYMLRRSELFLIPGSY